MGPAEPLGAGAAVIPEDHLGFWDEGESSFTAAPTKGCGMRKLTERGQIYPVSIFGLLDRAGPARDVPSAVLSLPST